MLPSLYIFISIVKSSSVLIIYRLQRRYKGWEKGHYIQSVIKKTYNSDAKTSLFLVIINMLSPSYLLCPRARFCPWWKYFCFPKPLQKWNLPTWKNSWTRLCSIATKDICYLHMYVSNLNTESIIPMFFFPSIISVLNDLLIYLSAFLLTMIIRYDDK